MLYVEGARDREILAHWARRMAPELVRCIERNSVILGGRRPARALSEFAKRGGAESGLRGLVVLDRDDREGHGPDDGEARELREAGLEVFVWSLRHIESYLLVPAAIRRVLRLDEDDSTVARAVAALMSGEAAANDSPIERSAGSIHAKRILGSSGALSEMLGAELNAGEIARAMVAEDFHHDILTLFERVGALSGLAEAGPEVVIRKGPANQP